MLGLAQFITKSRLNACFCALVGFFIPLLAPVTVSLVMLTQRFWEAGLIVLWAILLPAIIPNSEHFTYAPTLYMTVAMLILPLLGSVILKVTRSWVLTLLALSALSILLALMAPSMIDLNEVLFQFNQFINEIAAGSQVSVEVELGDLLAISANAMVLQSFFALALARWWQSELYHNGAFGNEIRALRLNITVCIPIVIIWAAVLLVDTIANNWQVVVILPLVVAGCSLLHWHGHQSKKFGSGFYIMLYVALFIFEPTRYIVASLALIDAVIDLRSRLKVNNTTH